MLVAMTVQSSAATRISTSVSEDPASPLLNTVAHCAEHCAVDSGSLAALGSAVGRQLLVRRSTDQLALYTVAVELDVALPAVHVGTRGLARLGDATGPFDATLRTDFIDGDLQARARLTEQLLGEDAAAGLAILAPHGGWIERRTDEQAQFVYRALARSGEPVRAWIARGVNAGGALRCWHITSSEISEHSFPKLRALFGPRAPRGPFVHAVAFHGHNDSESVVIGGGLPDDEHHSALKSELRSRIERALRAVMERPPVVTVKTSGPLAGAQRSNVVNRVTLAGNGIQIEQPPSVRDTRRPSEAIARAVAELYADRV